MTDYILRDDRIRATVIALLSKLDLTKPWLITVQRYRKKRSISQNALYWKWLGIIADETGNDAADLHEFFKAKFLPARVIEIGGESFERRSTGDQDTQSMSDYMTRVEAFATSNLGIILPHPEDQQNYRSAA